MTTHIPTVDEILQIQALRKQGVDATIKSIPPKSHSFTKLPDTQGNEPKQTKELAAPTKKTPAQKKWEIERLLEKHDLHPIEEMIIMVKEASITADQRIKLLGMLADYTVPKVKSIEVSGGIDHSITVNIMKFEDVVKKAQPANQASIIDVEAASHA